KNFKFSLRIDATLGLPPSIPLMTGTTPRQREEIAMTPTRRQNPPDASAPSKLLILGAALALLACQAPPTPEICDDGQDNAQNGRVDCADEACRADPACLESGRCDDGIDNDQDGFVDCEDAECTDDPHCLGPVFGTCRDLGLDDFINVGASSVAEV